MFIDTHAHLNFKAFKEDFDKVCQSSLDADVGKIINVGSNYETSLNAVRQVHKGDLFASVGVHPIHLDKDIEEKCLINGKEYKVLSRKEKFDYKKYLELGKNEGVVAIGETGLDYYHLNDNKNNKLQNLNFKSNSNDKIKNLQKLQKEVFEKHIQLANELDLPLILHCRGSEENPYDAYDEMIDILEIQISKIKSQNDGDHNNVIPYRKLSVSDTESRSPMSKNIRLEDDKLKAVIHCFVGSKKQADRFLEMGFYFGVNGIVTFNKSYELQDIVRDLPLDRIVLETDCPFLSPDPYRGKRNEPRYIPIIAKKIAQLKNTDLKKVENQTTKNAEKLFGI